MAKAVEAKAFFMEFLKADVPRICVENPIPGRIHGLPALHAEDRPLVVWRPLQKGDLPLAETTAETDGDGGLYSGKVVGIFNEKWLAPLSKDAEQDFPRHCKSHGGAVGTADLKGD